MNKEDLALIARLTNLQTIRIQANRILELARMDKLAHFSLDESRLEDTAQFVTAIILKNYPALTIPYHSRWRHFEADGYNRIQEFHASMAALPPQEMGKIFYELVIISVLLDAGAGASWRFYDSRHGKFYQRSEGLAVASFELYQQGLFSRDPGQPLRVDAERLSEFDLSQLKTAFQVNAENQMEGLEGRLHLLNRLGETLLKTPQFFGTEGRLGNFYLYIQTLINDQSISAGKIFSTVLDAFNDIWPQRMKYKGLNLGDVWCHSQLKSSSEGSEFVPFHKLSQWLTYSLIEPLEWTGIKVTDLNALTGLPEYRNGGLLVDMGVLKPRQHSILTQAHSPESEIVVEWRALTVALLDELAHGIQKRLHLTPDVLPLAKVLQGGTWLAGRIIAGELREGGAPPIRIISDGTVF